MAFTKFDCDVENISALPDEPSGEDGYTAKIIKSLFDKAAVDIKNYVNNTLIPQLEAETASLSIGSGQISGLEAQNNVFSQITALSEAVGSLRAGGVDEGSITADKLEDSISSLTELDARYVFYNYPGSYIFTVPGSGLYKVTVVGGGAAGSDLGGGMSGAYGVKWMSLTAGEVISLTVGSGGNGSGSCGGDSFFGDVTAQGGKMSENIYTSFSVCTNADIAVDGTVSVYQPITENINRIWGGDSPLGRGARVPDGSAGIGGGGYGNSADEYTAGGDGAVIIEYVHTK